MAERTRRPWTRIYGTRHPQQQNSLRLDLSLEKARKAEQRRRHTLSQRAKQRKAIEKGSPKIKRHLYSLDARRVFALDIEYTGLTADAEILQVSILNGLGQIVCNQYFRPAHVTNWDDTIPIHHITPEMVSTKPYFQTYAPQLSALFSQAESIVGYSTMQDVGLLHKSGVAMPHKPIYVDVGEAFSYVHEAVTGQRSYAKLQDCAAYYGYGTTNWHDSLADTKATLYCFYALLEDPEALIRLHLLKNQM